MPNEPRWQGENFDQDKSGPPAVVPALMVAAGTVVFCFLCGWRFAAFPLALIVGAIIWGPKTEAFLMLLVQALGYSLGAIAGEALILNFLKSLEPAALKWNSVFPLMFVMWIPFFVFGFVVGRNGNGVNSRGNQALVLIGLTLTMPIAFLAFLNQNSHGGDAGLGLVFILPIIFSVIPFPFIGWLVGISGLFGSRRGVVDE